MKSFLIFSFSALILPVIGGSIRFNGCSTDQQFQINEYLRDVKLISQAAERFSGDSKFHAWFGKEVSSTSDDKIKKRFHGFTFLPNSVPVKDVTFDCYGHANCCRAGQGGVPACGDQPGDDFVNICSAFWNWQRQHVYELPGPDKFTNEAIDVKYRTRGYVLLHELTHSQFGTLDQREFVKDKNGNNLECRGYGQFCIMKTAQKSPEKARKNADTYALFALASYYGLDKFQTNPDKLKD